jgi:NADPH-dependent curcumin reductase CurA
MASDQNCVVRFARTPQPGPLTADVLACGVEPIRALADGQIIVRSIYLSIDAGSRAQLDDRGPYVTKTPLGKPLSLSGCVGEVVASRHADWQAGDLVATIGARSQEYQVIDASKQRVIPVDPAQGPLAMHLGALGMVGLTAYVGIFEVGKPQAGETVLVSAAAGATGSLAGQFAKIAGARVVGIAGGADKCAFVKDELGFDDCVDYKAGDLRAALAAACPDGVDVYYENVGGEIQKAAFEQLNEFARVAMCGMVGQYSGEGEAPGPNLMFTVLKRVTLRGFLASDHWDLFDRFRDDTARWFRQGRIRHYATITRGLENLHEAINSLSTGKNVGKQLCQVADEPTGTRGANQ